ncbi:MAG: class I SAM-dependent methyltransferase [Flavobacteriales bacterium]|nr:class I SAM-dependent methyltransferase [Flavobacteriales bacterium]
MSIKQALLRLKPLQYYFKGRLVLNDITHLAVQKQSREEIAKTTARSQVINYLLSRVSGETTYLEIGVRDPSKNFDRIKASKKYSVDPGIEFAPNPVDFPVTSDIFFEQLDKGLVLSPQTRFDVIFIDGLHLAEQVDKDIRNALRFVKDDGFIVLHDCNPPSEWHARETHNYRESPAGNFWNGTTWKAFVKWRCEPSIFSCCIDSDWGVGVISKTRNIGLHLQEGNEFFEFSHFAQHRSKQLNLGSFEDFKRNLESAIK